MKKESPREISSHEMSWLANGRNIDRLVILPRDSEELGGQAESVDELLEEIESSASEYSSYRESLPSSWLNMCREVAATQDLSSVAELVGCVVTRVTRITETSMFTGTIVGH